MALPSRCITDVQDTDGNSYPRDADDNGVVILDIPEQGVTDVLLEGSSVVTGGVAELPAYPVLPAEHTTLSTRGGLIAVSGQTGTFVPLDFLVSAIGAPVEQVANNTVSIPNPSADRVMRCILLIGGSCEVFFQTENPNRIFTEWEYNLSGLVGPDQQIFGQQGFGLGEDGFADGLQASIDIPGMTPTSAAFDIPAGGTLELDISINQAVRVWDGVSEMSAVRTNFHVFGSTV